MLKSARMGRAAATGAIAFTLLGGAASIQAPAANAASRPSASAACDKTSFWAWIDASAANFRTGPSTHSTSLGLLHDGDRVQVTCATTSNWYYGKALSGAHRGQWGWVHHSVVLNHH
ncbi:SH3 domain-containing protein [Streptomyces sp. NBC_01456]|uniref:SH3 domain-containing protein n=1 Tax=unclassified Streptomyces TaxID=2593676 RepID=UPI002E3172A6|nr:MULTISPECIES: SH3 domain-containing protein [unclassified Streptomyces]